MGEAVQKEMQRNEIQSLIDWLATYGGTEEGGVTRLLYTKEWVEAQNALKNKMEASGFQTYFDQVGNLFGRVEGSEVQDAIILTGSHIDTVVQGGKYDGAYGVLASFLAVKRLLATYGPPKKTVEVVSLCEEEGSRFPLTYWGSKNMMGAYSAQTIAQLKDKEGIPFERAMTEAGFPLSSYHVNKREDIQHFVEIHIEQGSILEKSQKDIGLVSHIVGQKRYTITLTGESNHAGTTPMTERKDAMVCASKVISQLTAMAKEHSQELRVTFGQLIAKPNVSNVIAGDVHFTLDVRHHQEEVLDKFSEKALSFIHFITSQEQIDVSVEKWTDIEPVALDVTLHEKMKGLVQSKGFSYLPMISGAGHDAQVFGQYIPTSLLFVPSKKGISHSPLEYTAPHHLENGVVILMEYLYRLAY